MFWLALGSSSEAFQAAHGNEQKATSGSDAMPTVSRVCRATRRREQLASGQPEHCIAAVFCFSSCAACKALAAKIVSQHEHDTQLLATGWRGTV